MQIYTMLITMIKYFFAVMAEKSHDFGTKAKQITSVLVFAKTVEVEAMTVDRYGRTVAFVKVGDTVVNEELMPQGLARVFTRYCDPGRSASASRTKRHRPDEDCGRK